MAEEAQHPLACAQPPCSEASGGAQEELVRRIPESPRGRMLQIWIETTWGDRHYVGLSGLDIFDGQGAPVRLDDGGVRIAADPPDINVLPGYGSDPRTVSSDAESRPLSCAKHSDDLAMTSTFGSLPKLY